MAALTPVRGGLALSALALVGGAVALMAAARAPTPVASVEGEARTNRALLVVVEYDRPEGPVHRADPRAPVQCERDEKLTWLRLGLCFTPRVGGAPSCKQWRQQTHSGELAVDWQIADRWCGQEKLTPHAVASSVALRREQPPAGHYELFVDLDSSDEQWAFCQPPPRVRYWVVGERQRELIPNPFSWLRAGDPAVEECRRRCCGSPPGCDEPRRCSVLMRCNFANGVGDSNDLCKNGDWRSLKPASFAFDYP